MVSNLILSLRKNRTNKKTGTDRTLANIKDGELCNNSLRLLPVSGAYGYPGRSRTAGTSKMELFVITVNGFQHYHGDT